MIRLSLLGVLVLAALTPACANVSSRAPARAVSCDIERIDVGHPGAFAALPGEHRLAGTVTVRCRSQAQEQADIRLALMMRSSDVELSASQRPASSVKPSLQVYADEQLTEPIPAQGQAGVRHWLTVQVPAHAEIELRVPFFGKLVVPALMPAGTYVGASNLTLKVQVVQ